uniref:Uncharacterized protein n=1 Tax=Lepeophtheirus salmonis TaxID=72036 RepID=A0A0K2UNH1_LEPSM
MQNILVLAHSGPFFPNHGICIQSSQRIVQNKTRANSNSTN